MTDIHDRDQFAPVEAPSELSIEITEELVAQIGKLIYELEPSPVPDPDSAGFDQWVSETHASLHPEGRMVGSLVPPSPSEILKMATDAADHAKKAAVNAAQAAASLGRGLENTAQKAASSVGGKIRTSIGDIADEAKHVEALAELAVHQVLRIGGQLAGSIEDEVVQGLVTPAENALEKMLQEQLNKPSSPLARLKALLEMIHDLKECGLEIETRAAVVVNSLRSLGHALEIPPPAIVELFEKISLLFTDKKENIPKNLIDLNVFLLATINPLFGMVRSLFVKDNNGGGLLHRLMPRWIPPGTLHGWLTDDTNYMTKAKRTLPAGRIAQELAFRRMLIAAVDAYIRKGHTGSNEAPTSPAGTSRHMDQRQVLDAGLEMAGVFLGTVFAYLFHPPGLANPAVPRTAAFATASSRLHALDLRADMAASVARVATQPAISTGAVVLNGIWEVSPNNRALVDAVSGLVGHFLRSFLEQLLSGMLHMFEVHTTYPTDKKPGLHGYTYLYEWNGEEATRAKQTMVHRVYLNPGTALHAEPLKRLLTRAPKPNEQSPFVKLLQDYVAYRDAVIEYRQPAPGAPTDILTMAKAELRKVKGRLSIRLVVDVDASTIATPTHPVVHAHAGDFAVLLEPTDASHKHYAGTLNVGAVAKLFSKRVDVHVRSNHGGSASKVVAFP